MSSTNCFFAKVLYSLLRKVRVCCARISGVSSIVPKYCFFFFLEKFHLEFVFCIWSGNCGNRWFDNGAICMAAEQTATSTTSIKRSIAANPFFAEHKLNLELFLFVQKKTAIIDRWIPEPLVDDVELDHPVFEQRIISGPVGKRITVNGIDCLNMGSHNYLGLLGAADINESAIASVRKYGVGSCGPRGFYGTIDVHLELEERIAKFMEMEEAVVYSYGFSTSASAISAYCKRSDVVFV